MRITGSIILGASILAAMGVTKAESRSIDNYRSIVDRNPFGLKPVPPAAVAPPLAETNNKAKAEQFYLTGISTIGYPNVPKKAYLLNKDNSKKDYADKYYNLRINEKVGDLQLDDIDEKNKRVKVTYQGNEMWLSMKENGVPTPTGVAPQPGVPGMAPGLPAVPGMNHPNGTPTPLPGGVPVNTTAQPTVYPGGTSNRRMPRSAQFGTTMNGLNGVQGGAVPAPMYNPSVPGVAIQNQFGNPGVNGVANPAPANEAAVSPEVQVINMHAQKQYGASQGQEFPPLPPITP